jgi:hypothetical protein
MTDNNRQYDNKYTDGVLEGIGTIIRIMERAFVVFFDGLRNATETGTPSMLGFFSAIAPILALTPVAGMTATSLMTFFSWSPWQAWAMAGAIEVCGFVLWVSLVETLMDDGWNNTNMQYFFAGSVTVYHTVLILVNTILTAVEGGGGTRAWILLLLSLFPALGAVVYGYRNKKVEKRNTKQKKATQQQKQQSREKDKERKHELEKLKLSKAYGAETLHVGNRNDKFTITCARPGCNNTRTTSSKRTKYCSDACKTASHRNK